ncbi:MAG TPA: protein kinase, partial [Pseudomonadota bacterium]|nr:protein kinase [Pseudomonadota bacterium]
DLKPENVMLVLEGGRLGEVRVKILDFGIAKLAMGLGMSGGLPTRTGVLMGTPTYMAPEQCRGARGVDDKADVYALGVMFYQMLSGAPPFASQGAAEVMAQHVHEPPPPLLARAPQVSVKLAEFVEQMLSKQPTARPSMTAVEAWLAAMSATQGHRSEAEAGSTVLLGGSGGQSALVRRSSPDMPTQVAEDGNRPALLPANAPTQVASNPVLDAQTKLLPALSPATAETQIQNESVPISEQKTQFDLSQGDDPPTLRPNDAQQASADLRRRAETKLVVISETLFQPPKTSQLYFETARSWLGQAVERLQKHPNRKLFLWLLGAGGMMVLMLLFYALFG